MLPSLGIISHSLSSSPLFFILASSLILPSFGTISLSPHWLNLFISVAQAASYLQGAFDSFWWVFIICRIYVCTRYLFVSSPCLTPLFGARFPSTSALRTFLRARANRHIIHNFVYTGHLRAIASNLSPFIRTLHSHSVPIWAAYHSPLITHKPLIKAHPWLRTAFIRRFCIPHLNRTRILSPFSLPRAKGRQRAQHRFHHDQIHCNQGEY